MKRLIIATSAILIIIIIIWIVCAIPLNKKNTLTPDFQLISLSGKLLYKVKADENPDSIINALAALNINDVNAGLSNDIARKTFWINIYNAFFQILSSRDSEDQSIIFSRKAINIAGIKFTLDDIEHGILRKFRNKYSMGYLPQFCPSRLIKLLCVTAIDYRIHFALNCGAKSCPPIAFYNYDSLDEQLNTATQSFLNSETRVDTTLKEVRVTKIMKWFKADFGGTVGIKKILKQNLGKDFTAYSIEYSDYNWKTLLKNFNPN